MSEPDKDLSSINDIADDIETQEETDSEEPNKEDQKEENTGEQSSEPDPSFASQQEPYDLSVEDIPPEKRDKWIEQMLFEEEVTDERSIAGGEIPVVLKISTGESDVEIFDLVREYIEDVEDKSQDDYSDSEINTMVSISHCAHAVQTIKGERPGGNSLMAKFKWFNKKPIPLINRILKEYQKFEYEISLVLDQGEDIKK